MQTYLRSFVLLCVVCTLAGCSKIEPGHKPEEESARQIANRAKEIEAAAEAAVNQQIAEINATAADQPTNSSDN